MEDLLNPKDEAEETVMVVAEEAMVVEAVIEIVVTQGEEDLGQGRDPRGGGDPGQGHRAAADLETGAPALAGTRGPGANQGQGLATGMEGMPPIELEHCSGFFNLWIAKSWRQPGAFFHS